MHLPTFWLALAMAAGGVTSLGLGWRVSRVPPFPGRGSFAGLLWATTWWAEAAAIEQIVAQPGTKILWAEMAWPGIVSAAGFWALFVWNYIHGQYRPIPLVVHRMLLGAAALVWVLALTNDLHHLMYSTTQVAGSGPYMEINYFHGPLFYVTTVVIYAMMVLAEAMIVFEIVRSSHVFRTQYLGFAAAALLPWIFNIGYVTTATGTLDLTSLSFVAMDGLFYWLVVRRHLFNLIPIAHGMLLDAIPDPVLVIDASGQIAESNPAANALAGGATLTGRRLAAIPELGRVLAETLAAPDRSAEGPREIALGEPPRYFDASKVALSYAGRTVGHLILLRDISHRVALQQQLREQSMRDPLTGLHNRRFFDELAPVMFAEAQRSGTTLAAAMIDIDHFKRLNDSFGHAAGDAVLRAAGALLRQSIRQSDIVFRLGGEEFLVLLPNTQDESALRRVDEWRETFAAGAIRHDGKALTITFSAGVALFPDDADEIAALLDRADQALYRAKAEGRNRVVRWQAEMSLK